jgi:lipoprotein-anchoring transpeptidase ErfK/SrfK
MRQSSSPDKLRAALLGLALAAGLVVGPVAAQTTDPQPPTDFAQGADALAPGQYIWTPSAAQTGPLSIYVDLSRQLAAVYRGGVRIGLTTISSGKPGHETPTGVFTILQKDAKHHSNKYDNAPMPFQQRLTWDGVALHAGRVPGYPESHGCVHLPYTFAKALFSETRLGATVVITNGDVPDPTGIGAPETGEIATAASPEQISRRPTTAPALPVTMVSSTSD